VVHCGKEKKAICLSRNNWSCQRVTTFGRRGQDYFQERSKNFERKKTMILAFTIGSSSSSSRFLLPPTHVSIWVS
jgi:hypothetical protein